MDQRIPRTSPDPTSDNPSGPILVRPATTADREPVLAFCQRTFDWGDYIHEVWDDWLTRPQGILLVAESDGSPVAVGRASLASTTEGWLEGLRVHPDHRRRGVADAMNAAGRHWLWQHGAQVARLASWVENQAPQRQVERLGFQPVADYDYWVAAAAGAEGTGAGATGPDADAAAVRAAAAGDGSTLVATWSTSSVRHAARDLHAAGWRWRALTDQDILGAASRGAALMAQGAFALVHDSADGVRVAWLDGPASGWPALLGAARVRARRKDLAHASAILPALPAVADAARAAGFTLDTRFRVFELARPMPA